MSLTIREQSDQMKAASAGRLPADVMRVFDQSIEELVEQEIDTIKVGDHLKPFTLEDATGTPVALTQLLADGPVVIVFYRGSWCPYCNIALRTYQQELLPKLSTYGARLVAISPQPADESLSFIEKASLGFTVLSDPSSRLAEDLGIAFTQSDETLEAQRTLGLDLASVNAERSTRLPRPTVLVVDQSGTVRFVDVHSDYTTRTEVSEIIEALDALS